MCGFTDARTSELTALVKLISDSVAILTSEYAKAGHPPSALDSTALDPFFFPELVSEQLKTAIKITEAACAKLSATVTSAGHVVTNLVEPVCVRVVLDARITDHLLDKPKGLHVDELGRLSNQDQGKLGRVLRTLATNHSTRTAWIVVPNVFANNRLSMKLLSTDPVSSLARQMQVRHILLPFTLTFYLRTDEGLKCGAILGDVFKDPTTRKSYSQEDCAFHRARGVSAFDYYGAVRFPIAFFTDDKYSVSIPWVHGHAFNAHPTVYPWGSLPAGSIVVDVGGGNGHATLNLLKAFPSLKIIVQDTPAVSVQGREYPIVISEKKVDFIGFDFLAESPVTNGTIYYVRRHSHDWADKDCLKILKNVRKSAGPGSRFLISLNLCKTVFLPLTSRLIGTYPLLPNYGAANKRHYQQDMNMMIQFNSKERTVISTNSIE
ncbi:S-adenosyl-L-methionine-dependent methyltransferase [Pleurotus eryngii]|uniref:S-adenosyl-L-methionine-dependent methyltransferase n=1 Tax=Pleurotus eryngii TaxID=5323 RepID=A0A9P6DBN8_PLEER|nr:S-adenosyl-L-methionine-dependent methyltransferase [Pleurotus eryngii]